LLLTFPFLFQKAFLFSQTKGTNGKKLFFFLKRTNGENPKLLFSFSCEIF